MGRSRAELADALCRSPQTVEAWCVGRRYPDDPVFFDWIAGLLDAGADRPAAWREEAVRAGVQRPHSRRKLTLIGTAITERRMGLGLSRQATGEQLGVSPATVGALLYDPDHRPQRDLCRKLAAFLDWTEARVVVSSGHAARGQPSRRRHRRRAAHPNGRVYRRAPLAERRLKVDKCTKCGNGDVRVGSHPRRKTGLCWKCWATRRQVELTCDNPACGKTFPRARGHVKAKRYDHHFCSIACRTAWLTGRRQPQRARRPAPAGRWRRPTGKQAAKHRALRQRDSLRVVAERAGVSPDSMYAIANGSQTPTPLTRYRLERAQYFPPQEYHPLTQAVFEFCFDHAVPSEAELARRAGLTAAGLSYVLRHSRASKGTIEKLARAMERDSEELARLCPPPIDRWHTPLFLARQAVAKTLPLGGTADAAAIVDRLSARHPELNATAIEQAVKQAITEKRRPGRSPSYTAEQAREAKRLRDVEGMSRAKIGQRMGWPVKLDRHGNPSECPKAKRAYAGAKLTPP